MQPPPWQPPVELSQQEEKIVKKIKKAKLFIFLRKHRHELFDEGFQQELAGLYKEAERGQPPVAPAMLALALILEAYTGVSDDEVIEATLMDRRWQLVLDCVDTEFLKTNSPVHLQNGSQDVPLPALLTTEPRASVKKRNG